MAFYGLIQDKAHSQVQICGKNVAADPRGELQLTLHLPTRRQRGTQLSSGDWRLNPNLAIQRRPGPLIMSRGQDNLRAGKEAGRQCRQADRQGEERREERRVIEGNPDSLILGLFLALPDFLSPSVALALTCLSLARPLVLVQLLLLPPHNNRNLQK